MIIFFAKKCEELLQRKTFAAQKFLIFFRQKLIVFLHTVCLKIKRFEQLDPKTISFEQLDPEFP